MSGEVRQNRDLRTPWPRRSSGNTGLIGLAVAYIRRGGQALPYQRADRRDHVAAVLSVIVSSIAIYSLNRDLGAVDGFGTTTSAYVSR